MTPSRICRAIHTKLFALNFDDDEFNPDSLGILERLTPTIPGAHYEVQKGTPTSFGHLTMAHPELWAQHVGAFMQELNGARPGQPPAPLTNLPTPKTNTEMSLKILIVGAGAVGGVFRRAPGGGWAGCHFPRPPQTGRSFARPRAAGEESPRRRDRAAQSSDG